MLFVKCENCRSGKRKSVRKVKWAFIIINVVKLIHNLIDLNGRFSS